MNRDKMLITELAGPVVDQAALYGLLNKIRNLGLPLLSVKRIEVEAQGDNDER